MRELKKTSVHKDTTGDFQDLDIVDYIEYKDDNDITAFYLTKLSDNSFVVFAADDRSHVVMGVTDTNQDAGLNSIPLEFSYWIEDEIDAIEFARENNLEQDEEVRKEWINYKYPPEVPGPTVCVGEYYINKTPLLSTTWGQGVG